MPFGLVARPAGAWVITDGDALWKPAVDITLLISGGFLVAISYFYFSWRIARSPSYRGIDGATIRSSD